MTVFLAACGGGDAEPNTPDEAAPRAGGGSDRPSLMVGGTIGGLDKREVEKVVQGAWPRVSGCVNAGRKKLAIIGGAVGMHITVGSNGRATEVYLEESTLGDHDVEACIAKAFRAPQWPRPVGGEVGRIDQTFDFTSGHHEPPLSWTAAKLREGMDAEAEGDEKPFEEMLATLGACRKDAGTGPVKVTMYLDEDGFVAAAGMAVSDAAGDGAAECILQTVKTTSFPAPTDNYAKVTVEVP